MLQLSRNTSSRRPRMKTDAPCKPVDQAMTSVLNWFRLDVPSCVAISSPIPEPPPVTKATLSLRIAGLKGEFCMLLLLLLLLCVKAQLAWR